MALLINSGLESLIHHEFWFGSSGRLQVKNFPKKPRQNRRPQRQNRKTYELGVNQFTALTDEEFAQMYLRPIEIQNPIADLRDDLRLGDVDLVVRGAVNPLRM
jgi:ribosomal protein S30